MLLDTDAILRRILLSVFGALIACVLGYAVWYNSNLKIEFDEGRTETNQLREETSRLGAMNEELRDVTSITFKEVKNLIHTGKEDTVRLDNKLDTGLKEQNQFAKQLQQEQEKNKADIKQEISKLKEQSAQLLELLRQKELELKTETQKLKAEQEKLKNETKLEHAGLNQKLKDKEQELEQVKQQLQKEIEWRTKYYPLSR